MGRALARARGGEGPSALELTCTRYLGHFVGDPQPYRTPEELSAARSNDPLHNFRRKVTEAALLEAAELDDIETQVLGTLERAVETALAAPPPDIKTLETDVYKRY
jgi:pyruvate dehydrogenase E1 component alpha subunit